MFGITDTAPTGRVRVAGTCCGEDAVLDLPAPVPEALAGHRRMREAEGWSWGEVVVLSGAADERTLSHPVYSALTDV